jgi:hypothetical protein
MLSACVGYTLITTGTKKGGRPDMNGWETLINAIAKRFPDFSFENYEKVKALFPKEGGLVCWKRQSK